MADLNFKKFFLIGIRFEPVHRHHDIDSKLSSVLNVANQVGRSKRNQFYIFLHVLVGKRFAGQDGWAPTVHF